MGLEHLGKRLSTSGSFFYHQDARTSEGEEGSSRDVIPGLTVFVGSS
jgi:hypothetical protein